MPMSKFGLQGGCVWPSNTQINFSWPRFTLQYILILPSILVSKCLVSPLSGLNQFFRHHKPKCTAQRPKKGFHWTIYIYARWITKTHIDIDWNSVHTYCSVSSQCERAGPAIYYCQLPIFRSLPQTLFKSVQDKRNKIAHGIIALLHKLSQTNAFRN